MTTTGTLLAADPQPSPKAIRERRTIGATKPGSSTTSAIEAFLAANLDDSDGITGEDVLGPRVVRDAQWAIRLSPKAISALDATGESVREMLRALLDLAADDP